MHDFVAGKVSTSVIGKGEINGGRRGFDLLMTIPSISIFTGRFRSAVKGTAVNHHQKWSFGYESREGVIDGEGFFGYGGDAKVSRVSEKSVAGENL